MSNFISECKKVSSNSLCSRLKVGCVIVKDNNIISSGCNQYLPYMPHKSFVRDGHEQLTIHAESNAISSAAKHGMSVDGATAYITHYPCIYCIKILAFAGIKHIIYADDYKNDELVKIIADDAHIIIEKFES